MEFHGGRSYFLGGGSFDFGKTLLAGKGS